MNREIEFRAKRKDNNEWVYGYLEKQAVEGSELYITSPCNELLNYSNEVIPETISQYTGLKDNTGKKIFEGDILREYSNDIEDWVVSYEYGKFVGTYDNVFEDLYELSDLEVIGNIYDNPELLKED